MANTLEVRLSFKPVLDGLNRFASAVEGRMAQVREFNRTIENGAHATNQLLATVAAGLSVQRIGGFFADAQKTGIEFNALLEQAELGIAAVLKQFDEAGKFESFDDAIAESRRALDALKKEALTSPANFSTLVQAFQSVTGPMMAANIALDDQVNLIVNMSQALAGLGIHEEQILQETRALITGNINADAAAAKILGITSADITAAKQAGQLYEFLSSKIEAFAEAGERGAGILNVLRSNMGDAFEQRMGDLVSNLTEHLKELYAELTNLVESDAFGAVMGQISERLAGAAGVVTGLAETVQRLGPAVQIFVALANSTASWFLVLVALLAPLALLRGMWAVLLALANPLRVAFFGLAGVSFGGLLKDMVAFSAQLGVWKTFVMGNWAQRLALGLTMVAGVLAALTVGSALIKGLEQAAIARYDREDAIRQQLADQTQQLREQIAAAQTMEQMRATQADVEERAGAALERISELTAPNATRTVSGGGTYGLPSRPERYFDEFRLSGPERAELEQLRSELSMYEEMVELLRDPAWANRRLEQNLSALATAKETAAVDKLVEKLAELRAEWDKIRLASLDPAERIAELEPRRDALQNELAGIPLYTGGDPKEAERIEARRLDLRIRLAAIDKQIAAAAGEMSKSAQEELDAAEKRALFDLETQALAAEAAGNSALAEQLREQIRERELLNDLGEEAGGLVRERLAAEEAVSEEQRRQMELDAELGRQTAAVEAALARVRADPLLTEEEKNAATVLALQEMNRAIAERIALLERQKATASGDEAQTIQQRIDSYRQQQGRNAGEMEAARPLGIGAAAGAQMASYVDSLGTAAERAAAVFTGPLQTGIDLAREGMQGLLGDTQHWQQELGYVGGALMGSVTNAVSAMFEQWIAERARSIAIELGLVQGKAATEVGIEAGKEQVKTGIAAGGAAARAGIGAGETATTAGNVATQVGIHAAGEGAKTGSTFIGAIARKASEVGETVFLAVQWGLRTAAHLAGETMATGITLAQKALRLPAILAETGAYLAKAAVGAMSAMASIPYVGPILAMAAMAAIIAAGSKLLTGFATGGMVDGPEQAIRVNENGPEFVVSNPAVRKFGPAFLEDLNAGVLNLGALPGNVAAGMTRPDYAAGAPAAGAGPAAQGGGGESPTVNTYTAIFYDESQAMRWLENKQGQRKLIRFTGANRGEMGIET